MKKRTMMAAALAMAAVAGFSAPQSAGAGEFVAALIYDMGGKYDKSFNEAAFRGAERFTKEAGTQLREFEVTNPIQREQALRNFARRGTSVIVGNGFPLAFPIKKVALEFPDVKFCLSDENIEARNVRSYTFKGNEGAFLVGVLAAMASKSGKVGFVGGMDIPLVRNFAAGYQQGVRHVNPKAEIYINMTGITPAAWNDPTRGAELARSQFDRGADVIFAAAGTTGLGVLQAVADAGKLGIGMDSNQNGLHPGRILTSLLKRTDEAVYRCLRDTHAGKFSGGHEMLGLKEGGLDWALDANNRALITPEMETAVNAAKDAIIAGTLVVDPYKP